MSILNLTNKDQSLIDEGVSKLQQAMQKVKSVLGTKLNIGTEKTGKNIAGLNVESLKKGGEIAKSIAQGTARSGAAVALELQAGTEKLRNKLFNKPLTEETQKREFELPETASKLEKGVYKTIFGEGKLKGFQGVGEETLKSIGAEKLAEKKIPSYIIGLGLSTLDFTTGGGKDDVLKAIVKINKTEDALNLARKIGVSDDLIENFAEGVVKVKNIDEAKKLVSGVENIQKTTKVAETGLKERGFISSVKEELPELKVAGQYVPRNTDRLAIKAANEVKLNLAGAEKIALTGTSDEAVATGAELLKHYNEQAKLAKDLATRNVLYDKAGELANTMARNLTEQGRSIQAASILGRLTPEGQLRFAAREIQKYNEEIEQEGKGLLGLKKKIPEITGEQSKKILDEMNVINKMADGTEKAMRFQKLQNYISDLVPSTLMSKVIAVWKAGLLTGLKTSGLNILSNLSHASSEIIKDIPAKVVDSVASLFTGQKTIGLTTKGVGGGIKEGFQKGIQYLKTGYDERNLGLKLDWKRVNFGKGKISKTLQKYEETVFRVLGTEDQPFYYGAKARSLYSQAIAEASNKGLKGIEKQKFINNLVENPTEKMLKYAINDAETAVFQNKTALGSAAKKIQEIGGGVGEFVLPFGRTPSAVATQIINYSPVGIVKTIVQNIGRGKFDQRLFAQGLGRGITGTGVLYLGYEMGKKGIISLDRPTTEKEQKLWELQGKQGNSIKIGGKWRTVQTLGPIGNLLLVGAQFQKAFKELGSTSEAWGKAIAGSLKSFTQQTFLSGTDQILSAINNPEQSAASYITSQTSSIIPTIVKDIATSLDPTQRRTEKIIDGLKSRIPLLRETLEPRINVFGQEVQRPGNAIETLIDPTRPSNVLSTPLLTEIERLWGNGFKVSPTLLGDKKGYKGLSPEINTELWKRAGEITESKLENLIKLGEYAQAPDDKKAKLIESITDKSKLVARVEMVIKLTNGLIGDELKNKLSELKKSGLMTSEVFNNYLKLR